VSWCFLRKTFGCRWLPAREQILGCGMDDLEWSRLEVESAWTDFFTLQVWSFWPESPGSAIEPGGTFTKSVRFRVLRTF
jgi:hypothetical protein